MEDTITYRRTNINRVVKTGKSNCTEFLKYSYIRT